MLGATDRRLLLATKPELYALYEKDPELYQIAIRAITAFEAAPVRAAQHSQHLKRILKTQDNVDLLVKWLLSEQRAAIEADRTLTSEAQTESLPHLTSEEAARVQTDPIFVDALRYWLSEVHPDEGLQSLGDHSFVCLEGCVFPAGMVDDRSLTLPNHSESVIFFIWNGTWSIRTSSAHGGRA